MTFLLGKNLDQRTTGVVQWKCIGAVLAGFVAIGVLCKWFATSLENTPILWIPSALGIASVLRLSRQSRPALLAGLFFAGIATFASTGTPLALTLQLSTWSVVEISLGAFLIERFVGALSDPVAIDETLKTLFLAIFVAHPVGAGFRATSLHLHDGAPWLHAAVSGWASTASGTAIVLMPCLAIARSEWFRRIDMRKIGAFVLQALTATAMAILLLELVSKPFVFITLPFIIVATRKGLVHVAALTWFCILAVFALVRADLLVLPDKLLRDGVASLWASTSVSALFAMLAGVVFDQISLQIRLLQNSESRFRSILDSATTGFAMLDGTGAVLNTNPFLREFLGWKELDLLGKPLTDLVADEHREGLARSPERFIEENGSKGLKLKFANGSESAGTRWGRTRINLLAGIEQLYLLQIEDITDATIAEMELQRSRSTLQTLIDNIPSMISLWDADFRNRFANKAYLEWCGRSQSEIVGAHARDVIGDDSFERNKPLADSALSGETVVVEREISSPEGKRYVLATYIPCRVSGAIEGFYTMVTDITTVKVAQQAQLDSLTRLRDIIDGASEFSIIATDLQGVIRLFSHGAERMLGWKAQEMVDLRTPETIHTTQEIDDLAKEILERTGRKVEGFDVFVDAAKRGEADSRVWTYVRKDGSTLSVQLVITPLHNHLGEIDGYMGVARDISSELEAIRAIEDAREQAEHASLMKSEFVANMSHEIRTPMNAVLGMVQLMGKTSISPSQRKYLDMIRKSGRSLLGILDDILDFSKIEAGRMRIEPVDFLLDDVLENIANIASVNASGKDLEISITIDPTVPVQLHGDSLRLQQVLVNLMGNALKFTMQGEVAMSIEVLSTDENCTRIGFRIRDTGIGMTDEQQRRLFQPFSQMDSSNTRRFGGTGLGLTISKKLLDMMGGQVGVRSMSQIGTEFFVSIPFPNTHLSEPDAQALSIRPLSILALEDHPSSQTSLEASAARWGWKIEFAPSLAQCLELLERRELIEPFDAILVDSRIPDWTDRSCIEEIREICQREITIVKMVRTAVENPADEGIRLLDGILVKPITPISLLKVLKNNLGHQTNEEEESRIHLERVAEERQTLQGVRVLLVEDNAFNQVVATETLQALGAGVDLAENGKAAVERLKRDPGSYDLVLMDVQMPVMDGYAATRAIRQELHIKLPVIAMTAGVLPSDRDKCMACGMDDFITKPFEVDDLVRIFRRHLALSQGKEKAPSQDSVKTRRKTTFQPEQLISTLGGAKDAIRTARGLVRQFLDTAPGSIRMGRECVGRGDLEEATRAFHNLKSSAATLGAMAFASLAQQIELALQESERKNLAPLMEKLSEEYDRVCMEADKWLRTTDPGSLSDPPTGWTSPGSKGVET